MCWESAVCPIPLIAEKDIPILKVGFDVGTHSLSPIKWFKYEYNVRYDTDNLIIDRLGDRYMIDRGFHSYDPRLVNLYKSWNRVLAAYGSTRLFSFNGGCDVFEGFIPQGAHYYSNLLGELVSDAIVITNIRRK